MGNIQNTKNYRNFIRKDNIKNENSLNLFAFLIVSIPIILFCIVMLFITFNCIMGLWSNSWPITKGNLVYNYDEVEKVPIPSDSRYGTSRSVIEKNHRIVEYTYKIDNVKYVSNRVSYFDSFMNDKKYFSIDNKILNAEIDIHYNRYFPQFSVLKSGLKFEFEDILIVLFVIIVALVFYKIMSYSGEKSNFG